MTEQSIYYSFISALIVGCFIYLLYSCIMLANMYKHINTIDNNRKLILKKILMKKHKLT